jgi:hypothetical protein
VLAEAPSDRHPPATPPPPAPLQELIQNADDAGARDVEFCLDTRQHAVGGLVGGLASFQGPALLAFNSAKFTEDDFKSIRVRLGS